jgi:acyl-coenzyme A synthetase/AMP-(fatty) acid ligase
VTVYDGIGQSESHIFLANQLDKPIKPGALGTPLPGYRVAIFDDGDAPLPTGEPGHLMIANDHPGLTLGYYRDPERWASVNRAGWYDTKDFASVDEDGYYWFVGRADDVIISAGYRIGPFEVESALLEHPAVLESAVVAAPDVVRGQVVKAYVVLRPGAVASEALAREIQEHVKRTTAPYKYPRQVEFIAALPKTVSGKIRRVELREQERRKT